MVEDFSTQFYPLYLPTNVVPLAPGHPVYRVSQTKDKTSRGQVERVKLSRKVLYHFVIFAMIFELLNVEVGRIRARGKKAPARLGPRPAQCVNIGCFPFREHSRHF